MIKTRSKIITHFHPEKFNAEIEKFLATIDKHRIWKDYPKTLVTEASENAEINYHFHCLYDVDVEAIGEVEEVVNTLEGGEIPEEQLNKNPVYAKCGKTIEIRDRRKYEGDSLVCYDCWIPF